MISTMRTHTRRDRDRDRGRDRDREERLIAPLESLWGLVPLGSPHREVVGLLIIPRAVIKIKITPTRGKEQPTRTMYSVEGTWVGTGANIITAAVVPEAVVQVGWG